MKNYNWLYLLPLLFTSKSVLPQNNIHTPNAQIIVHFKDEEKDEVFLKVVEDYIYGYIGNKEYQALPDKRGYYKFSIPIKSRYASIDLEFGQGYGGVYNNFLEPGDSILIECNDRKKGRIKYQDIQFYGKGSSKFIAAQGLQRIVPNNIIRNKTNFYYKNTMDTILAQIDSTYLFRKRYLNRFRTRISKKILDVLKSNAYGKSNIEISPAFDNYFTNSSDHITELKNYSSKYVAKKFDEYSLNSLQAPGYLDYLENRALIATIVNKPDSKIDFYDLYNSLLMQNNGLQREKILMYTIFKKGFGTNKIDFILNDVLKYIKNKKHRELILRYKNSTDKGSLAYDFSLPDTLGTYINLKSLRGKTVLVDCWFTGCSSCSDLSKKLEREVVPQFKNDSNMVFVSVCVDRSKKTWIKSIKTGLYTNDKNINLFTDGLGLNHPFIKRYQFNGFPKLILIDKYGKIFSTNLIKEPIEIIAIMKSALND